MLRPFQRGEAGDHGIVQVEAGRGRATRGEGRGVQLVIGEQDEGAADQVGCMLVVWRPGLCDLLMQRLGRGLGIEHGRDQQPDDARADHGAAVGRAGEGAWIGAGGQREHGDGAVDRRRAACGRSDRTHLLGELRLVVGGERIDVGDIPEQRRGVLQRAVLGKIDAVDAAVDRALLRDGRDLGIHHRQIGVEAAQAARLRRRHPALLQRPDVLGTVAVLPRVRRRLGADQAAADIGVERGRRDRELGRGLPGGEIKSFRIFHIDLCNQD